MQKLFASPVARSSDVHPALQLFGKLFALEDWSHPQSPDHRRFYRRAWCPLMTLWYLIWQRLSPQHTLDAAVRDARRGGADALRPSSKPLSARLVSSATTALAKARARLPLDWVVQGFERMARQLAALGPSAEALPVRLLDGSTLRLRPHGDIPKHFPPHRTCRKKAYWCVARTVVCFGAESALALAAQLGSIHLSEQALAVRLILAQAARALYVGDRNFGVWRVVRATVQAGGHALVRLTGVRAGKLAAGRRLRSGLDLAVEWGASAHDQVDRGLEKKVVAGRLVVVRVVRRGWRAQQLYLFTTLTDAATHLPAWLVEQYGRRWQVEVNLRWVKATMGLGQLEVKSADLARKEFYAGLMAYNLVRGIMGVAARAAGAVVRQLSFAAARTILHGALGMLWLNWVPARRRWEELERVCREVGRARLPRRRKARPAEPRAQYHVPQAFPPMRGTRSQARQQLKQSMRKS
jgi:Transposase DDE domain